MSFDRSAPLPTGGHLEQADGTAWMAFYAQSMLQISLELALDDRSYVDMALKFFEHFVWIASAMIHIGGKGEMWDEEDGFFYDVLRTPDGRARKLKVRSMVGLLPLCAATVVSEEVMAALPELQQRAGWFVHHRPHLVTNIHDPRRPGYHDRRLLSLLSEERLRRVLARMLDENEFLSPFGIRSLSRHHLEHPYVLAAGDHRYKIGYLPAESDSGAVRWQLELARSRLAAGQHACSCARCSTTTPTTARISRSNSRRAPGTAPRCTRSRARSPSVWRASSRSTAAGGGRSSAPRRSSPTIALWRDHLLFYEYFHGDNGAGIGASHQTGWTGLIASLLHFFATESSTDALNLWTPRSASAAASPAWPRRRPGEAERRT